MFDILVAGEINPDLILTGDVKPEFGQVEKIAESAALTVGSSCSIFACGAARLGLKVAFAGVCGDDVFGRFMLDAMQDRGVDTSAVIVRPDRSTGISVILNLAADRAILTYPGLIPALRASDIPDTILRQARHLHVASYFLQTNLRPDLPALFRLARSYGLTTSLDTNYDPSGEWKGMDELLPLTDVFLPNRTEALGITHAGAAEDAARQLARSARMAVVKLGAQGALLCEGDSVIRSASIPVPVVDSVGAGDSFDAGFLLGFLNGWKPERALRIACVCGALSMRKAGGTEGQPTAEEALAYVPG
ncbi:MAG TPA: sugar kinase [Anaerolineales bacterium]|nr:sugar kinase [Anaerolineales bacterium]